MEGSRSCGTTIPIRTDGKGGADVGALAASVTASNLTVQFSTLPKPVRASLE